MEVQWYSVLVSQPHDEIRLRLSRHTSYILDSLPCLYRGHRHFNENLVRVDCKVDATELEERQLNGTIDDFTPVAGNSHVFQP